MPSAADTQNAAIEELSKLTGLTPGEITPETLLALLKAANAAAPAVPAAPVRDPADEVLVTVFNRNPPFGSFTHEIYEAKRDQDGKIVGQSVVTTHRAEGNSFAQVPKWLADKWKKMFPGIIVDSAEVGAPRTGFQAADERVKAAEAKATAASAESAALAVKLENMQKMIVQLQQSQNANPSES